MHGTTRLEVKQREHAVLVLVHEPDGFAEVPDLLTRDGFRVLCPPSVDEAVNLACDQKDIGIVVCDIVWKDTRGAEIYQRLQKKLAANRYLSVVFLAEAASIN